MSASFVVVVSFSPEPTDSLPSANAVTYKRQSQRTEKFAGPGNHVRLQLVSGTATVPIARCGRTESRVAIQGSCLLVSIRRATGDEVLEEFEVQVRYDRPVQNGRIISRRETTEFV